MKNFNRRNLAFVLVIVMTLVMLPIHALAAEKEPVDVECQLNIVYNYGSAPIPGADFNVYKVGEVYMNGETELTGEFAGLNVDFTDATQLRMSGITMYNYACEQKIEPDYVITTNEEGKVSLLALDAGIYLVVGQPVIEGDDGFFTDPQVIFFPHNTGLEGEYWDSNITIKPKATSRCILDPLVYKTKKLWADEGLEEYRPDSVTVRLYKNGVEYDKVVLSKANNWSCVWKDLDPKSEWTLKEDVVIDYRAEINLDNDTFIVKNTYDGDRDPHDKTIIQTGQLWWPVPVMAVLGMVLVVFGMLLTRREKHEK